MKNVKDIKAFPEIDNIEFIAKQVVEGFITGLHKSPYHGFSVEFAEHRAYNSGESIKDIDWKLYARTEKLFVKRYEEETNLRSRIVIDTSSSMHYAGNNDVSKLQYSVYCAAALIYLLRKQRDAVGLTLFNEKIDEHLPSKLSDVHAKLIYAKLHELLNSQYSAETKKTTKASELLHQIAENTSRRSLVIIFSDLLDYEDKEDVFSALQHLKHNNHEVIFFRIINQPKEQELSFENRPFKFVDMETGEELKLNPGDIKNDYKQKTNNYFNEIKLKTGQFNIDYVEVDINKDFMQVLLPYLIKRNNLF